MMGRRRVLESWAKRVKQSDIQTYPHGDQCVKAVCEDPETKESIRGLVTIEKAISNQQKRSRGANEAKVIYAAIPGLYTNSIKGSRDNYTGKRLKQRPCTKSDRRSITTRSDRWTTRATDRAQTAETTGFALLGSTCHVKADGNT